MSRLFPTSLQKFLASKLTQQGSLSRIASSFPEPIQPPSQAPSPIQPQTTPTIVGPISQFSSHRQFFESHFASIPVHALRQKLPRVPTDIKGVDQMVYRILNRKLVVKNVPQLIYGPYVHLRFYPESHVVSLARKSNVAYMFTNRGGFALNSKELETSFLNYNGKYKRNEFFQRKMMPLDTSVNRSKYRKFVKRCLFNSLHRHVQLLETQLPLVRGVFQFRLLVIPVSQKEKEKLAKEIDKVVESIVKGKNKKISQVLPPTSREVSAFMRELRLMDAPGAKNVPGYFPKYPFLKQFDSNTSPELNNMKKLSNPITNKLRAARTFTSQKTQVTRLKSPKQIKPN